MEGNDYAKKVEPLITHSKNISEFRARVLATEVSPVELRPLEPRLEIQRTQVVRHQSQNGVHTNELNLLIGKFG